MLTSASLHADTGSAGSESTVIIVLASLLAVTLLCFIMAARKSAARISHLERQISSITAELEHFADGVRETARAQMLPSPERPGLNIPDDEYPQGDPYSRVKAQLQEARSSIIKKLTDIGEKALQLNASYDELDAKYRVLQDDMAQCTEIEEALMESEKKFKTISFSALDGIVMINNDGDVSFWNPAAERIFGYAEQEILGKNVHSVLAMKKEQETFIKAFPHWQKTGEGPAVGRILELTALRRDGDEIPVEISLSSVKTGGLWSAIAIVRDVSERKMTEMALHSTEERLRSIYESSDAFMFLTDKVYFDCNQRTLDMFCVHNKEDFIDRHPGDFSPPQQPDGRDSRQGIQEHIRTAFQKGVDRFEWTHRRNNGENFPSEVLLSTFDYLGEKVLHATVRDITVHKEMQNILQKAKEEAERSSHVKSEFLAWISHEIRTPMNAVIGFTELLKGRTTDEKSKEYLQGILTAGKNLLALIEDILDLSKIEAGKMEIHRETVNLHSFCEEIDQVYAVITAEKGIELRVEVNPYLPGGLMLDEVRLRQVILNLIGNAIKFTEKGAVIFRVSTEESNTDMSALDLIFEIQDTGIGINESQKETIFEAFRQSEGQSTRRFGGTGLGLTITRKLVEMMEGTISLESEPGCGSLFRVKFPHVPVVVSEPLPSEDIQIYENIQFHGAVILLVEDMESNRRVIAGLLESHGIVLLTAADGQEAIETISLTMPDMILMDLQMPLMDGYEAARTIKENEIWESILIIALTAHPLRKDLPQHPPLFDGYLQKPVTKNRLLQELAQFLPYSIPEITPLPSDENVPVDDHLERVPEVMQRLAGEFYIKWKEVNSTMIVEDIKNFAHDIGKVGFLYGDTALQEYGETLYHQASSFKINRMMKTLEEFPDFMVTRQK